jgi:hypothetical protein
VNADITLILRLKGKLKGLLRMFKIRNRYDCGDPEFRIGQLDQFRPFILKNDGIKPVFSFHPCHYEPVLADLDRFSLHVADSQIIGIFSATRSEIHEMLLVENSEIRPEENEYQ